MPDVPADPELHRRIRALYAAVDREIAASGVRCDASGRCCRFKEYGHALFLSNLEAEVLLANAPHFSGPVSADFCPWQQGTLCTAREPRPLGCRVYHCDPAFQERSGEITETYLRQLKRLAVEFGVGWRYAPLHFYLEEALWSRPPAPPSDSSSAPARVELPVVPG